MDSFPFKIRAAPCINKFLLCLFPVSLLYLFLSHHSLPPPHDPPSLSLSSSSPLSLDNVVFSIASSSSSLSSRIPFISLWYNPNTTRAFLFLDRIPPNQNPPNPPSLPPILVFGDTSAFPYTFKGGLKSAIRVARIVKEIVGLNLENVKWFVFGDDDTVFFKENLVRVLGKYDWERWYYVGSNSENYEQNVEYSFDMAFGGGGFAISYGLGLALARVFDDCLMRYGHLYGSDARVFSCLAELGVGLTHEPGFHQVDMRGNLFGMLSAHPLSLLVSLHHVGSIDPIFPNKNRTEALRHLFEAVDVDSARILQQSVCYDHSNLLTISIAWGFAIEVYEGNLLLPDLLPLWRTFMPWRRNRYVDPHYMFNVREYSKDPCERPALFFLESVISHNYGVWSNYTRHGVGNCQRSNIMQNLELVKVFSPKLELDIVELKAPRRQCCDVSSSAFEPMVIGIRPCGAHELISMQHSSPAAV
ncbi:Protein of unknown function DUF604 [Dillenia turbinata]|uniref:Uncharacterized protein n=1 Tax=Dillenia turbinata TaxID=194707 RepID=A0AAN8Z3K5_9MAGN